MPFMMIPYISAAYNQLKQHKEHIMQKMLQDEIRVNTNIDND